MRRYRISHIVLEYSQLNGDDFIPPSNTIHIHEKPILDK